jgi:glycosyltransferase involved in cell wall biosynthesis
MNVLLIAHTFPPYNTSGSVRAAKLAEYLLECGYDVRVISGRPLPYPETLLSSFPKNRVTPTHWRVIEAPLDVLRARLGHRVGRQTSSGPDGGPSRPSLAARAVVAYRSLLSIPDAKAGWILPATAAGRRLFRSWQPGLIYSTALPFSSHIVAARLAKAAGCPWVGEYRDLFSGNPYREVWRARARLDEAIERRTMSSASALISVSPLMTDYLARMHKKPAVTIMNGFDPADFERAPDLTAEFDSAKIAIIYTGIIYPGRRDPSLLFEALRRLGRDRHRFDVRFYGQSLEGVTDAARRFGVEDIVRTFAPVPYLTSLGLQMAADVLLLLLWDSPFEKMVLTGKLFEYVGAGRPILSLGCEDGAAAGLVRERALGLATNDADAIVSYLWKMAAIKARDGATCAARGEDACVGLSRREQFRALERFLGAHGLLPERAAAN